jgi:U32 family peptidase
MEGIDHHLGGLIRRQGSQQPAGGVLETCSASGWWIIQTEAALKQGDGLVFEAPGYGPPEPPAEVGGRLMAVQQRPMGRLAVRLGEPLELGVEWAEGLDKAATCQIKLRPSLPCWQPASKP